MSQISLLLLLTLLLNYESLAHKLENSSQILKESSQNISVAETPFYSNNGQEFDNVLDLDNATHFRSKRNVELEVVKLSSGYYKLLPLPDPSTYRCTRANNADFDTITKWGKTAKEYKIIVDEMEKTKLDLPNCEQRGGCVKSYKIFKIRKVKNGCLWQRYLNRKDEVEAENNGEANERMLFHGTEDALGIANSGFDERHVTSPRSFGPGIYFATSSSAANELAYGKAKTGCPGHDLPDCDICKRRMILARVVLGREHTQVGAKKFAHAPVGSNSVIGNLMDSRYPYNDYVVYRGEQAYPEYVISYVIRTE